MADECGAGTVYGPNPCEVEYKAKAADPDLLAGILNLARSLLHSMPGTEGSSKRTVTGTGTGRHAVEATMAKVILTLETSGRTHGTASEVQAELTERSKAVLDHLENENVQKLHMGGVSLSRKPGRGFSSFGGDENTNKGSSMLTFQVPLKRAGEVQDSIAATGGVSACRVKPFAIQDDVDTAHKEAIDEAVAKAREEAQSLAGAIGMQLGGQMSIHLTSKNPSDCPELYYDSDDPYPPPTHGETVLVDVDVEFEQAPLAA